VSGDLISQVTRNLIIRCCYRLSSSSNALRYSCYERRSDMVPPIQMERIRTVGGMRDESFMWCFTIFKYTHPRPFGLKKKAIYKMRQLRANVLHAFPVFFFSFLFFSFSPHCLLICILNYEFN
jgi:hypothetical protein